KDHAVLLKQLLDSAGIPAHLALVNATGTVATELPSMDQFNHMIAFVPSSSLGEATNATGGMPVDCTEKDADPLLFPSFGLEDKSILVLDAQQPRLVHIPKYPADAGQISSSRQITIQIDAANPDVVTAQVLERVTFNAYAAPIARAYLRLFEPGERR